MLEPSTYDELLEIVQTLNAYRLSYIFFRLKEFVMFGNEGLMNLHQNDRCAALPPK